MKGNPLSQPILFTPFRLGSLDLPNRIIIEPMCQYSAEEGRMTDWHLIHLGQLALSGAGLLVIEATAVEPEGRISAGDVGLWDDATEAALGDVVKRVREWSPMPIAIQLGHAGRKASARKPWEGAGALPLGAEGGWQTFAPSPLGFFADAPAPVALDRAGMNRVRDAFADAARRAVRIGVDSIQIHAAHGYLLHQFLSPISNRRDDEYGGSVENRMRFPLEVFDAVRAACPAEYPITVRISAVDWVEGGLSLEDSIRFAQEVTARGCVMIDVSSGGLDAGQKIPVGPGYQVPLARAVRQAVSVPVAAVGLITEPTHAEAILGNGDADLIGLARTVLYDPRWPWHAAAALGAQVGAANQYLRCQPASLRNLFVPHG